MATVNDLLTSVSMSCSYGHMSGEMTLMRVYTNTIQMLTDRGYTSVSQKCSYVHHILDLIQKEAPVATAAGAENKKNIKVYFHIENKIGIKNLRNILEADKGSDDIVCVISTDGPTTFTKKDVSQLEQEIQFLTFKNMFNNISQHSMVPKHRKLTEEELHAVKIQYNIQSDFQWPKLLMKDPVRVWYDFQREI